ncbi:MAG: hypothetical protein AAF547_08030, partial [Actinomycetota bacterium]
MRPRRVRSRLAIVLAAVLVSVLAPVPGAATISAGATVFINELHYDNTGGDVDEFVEIAGPAGTDLSGWSIVFYNGSTDTSYATLNLSGVLTDESDGYGFESFLQAGIQNGGPDGLALVDDTGAVVEFLSYEGTFTASGGPADGLTSTDIGVSEVSSTPIGQSLQRTGTGSEAADFVFAGPAAATVGAVNTGQTIDDSPPPPPPPDPTVMISELHYDNASTDTGEFVEVEGDAGTDLAGWSIVFYNGSSDTSYATLNLSGVIDDEGSGVSALFFLQSGIQNGAPDGLALVDDTGSVVEFLSYEGVFTASGGPADGLTSTDLGVAESSSTPVGQSLQKIDGLWTGPADESPGDLNTEGGGDPAPLTLIHDIQGPGDTSPIEGDQVKISGIVVGDFQAIVTNDPADEPLDGFMVQEEDADADGDPSTSEGIFVFAPGGTDVSVGDLVEVTGTVDEFFGLTELNAVTDITIISSGNPLPSPATPTVPTSLTDPVLDWEAIEGMSVSFGQPLFVTGMFPLGSFGEVQLSAIGAQDHPNQVQPVGSQAATDVRELNQRSRVILDDGEDEDERFPEGLSTWNPDPTPYLGGPENTLRSGDVVNDLFGVVHFAFGDYEVQPVNLADATDPDGGVTITRTPRPTAVPDVGGDLTVASFNVLNYFTTIDNGQAICGPPSNLQRCRGADTQAEFDLQSTKIADAIADLDADIVG